MNYLKVMSAVIVMAGACLLMSCGSSRLSGDKRPQLKADNGKKVEASQIVDLGLKSGTLWAGWNIGANSPEGCGDYYAWGEVKTKKKYDWDDYFDLKSKDKDEITFKAFNPEGNSTIMGNPDVDVATALWGAHWSMPSKAQIDELLRDCQWTWTSLKGRHGFVVKGPNGKCLFLPAAGCYFESSNQLTVNHGGISQFDQTCFYWCGELDDSYDTRAASCLIMCEDYPKFYDRIGSRSDGKPVRAVYHP